MRILYDRDLEAWDDALLRIASFDIACRQAIETLWPVARRRDCESLRCQSTEHGFVARKVHRDAPNYYSRHNPC